MQQTFKLKFASGLPGPAGGSGLSSEQVDDRVATLLQAGSNITLTYNDVANTLTIAAAGGGGGLTVEEVDDRVAALLQAGSNISLSYNDVANTLTITADGGLTSEQVDDRVAALLQAGSNVSLAYNDVANTLTISAAGAGSGGDALTFDTRTDAIAATIDSSANWIRTLGYSAIGDWGGGIYHAVASEPTHEGKLQSADGQWWELQVEQGQVWVEQFGAKGDMVDWMNFVGATDNTPLILDAHDFCSAIYADYNSPAQLRIGPGMFMITGEMNWKNPCGLEGIGMWSTFLLSPGGAHGIIVNRKNTLGDPSAYGVTAEFDTNFNDYGRGADYGKFGNLMIYSDWDPVNDPRTQYHGIVLRARAHVHHMHVGNFSGVGYYIAANAPWENANNWLIEHCEAYFNGIGGFNVWGPDANAGLCQHCDFSWNGEYGALDRSFLGNAYNMLHTSDNGRAGSNNGYRRQYSGRVRHNGFEWYARYAIEGVETVWTNWTDAAPGVDGRWVLHGGDGTYPADPGNDWPAWDAGSTYRPSFPYGSTNINARSVWTECYAEAGHYPCAFLARDLVLGGLLVEAGFLQAGAATIIDDGRFKNAVTTQLIHRATTGDIFTDRYMIFGATHEAPTNIVSYEDEVINGGVTTTHAWWLSKAAGDYIVGVGTDPWQEGYWWFRWTSPTTQAQFGRGAAQGGQFWLPRFHVGENGSDARQIAVGTAAPASGTYARGDRVLNRDPAAGGFEGWICVTGGSPGTWKTYGAISA